MLIEVTEVQDNYRIRIEHGDEVFFRFFPKELTKVEIANRLHSLAAELRGDVKNVPMDKDRTDR